jgi:hypothetical protein
MNNKDQIYNELRIRAQLSVLRDVRKEYTGRTIDNIIDNLQARLDFYERANDN